MKTVLTVRQPFASLIIRGGKDIENRTWSTSYRGPLHIHAAGKWHDMTFSQVEERFAVAIDRIKPWPLGAIIGHVDLVDIVTGSQSKWFMGPFGWVLENPVEYPEPIPMNGKRGLFTLP